MTTPFSRALGQATSTLRRLAGVSVAYARSGSSCTIAGAVRGDTRTERADEQGSLVVGYVTDWILPADQIAPSGSVVKPQEGDTITEIASDGLTVRTWEVIRLADEVHRPSGESGIRVHVQLVSEEATT